MFQRVLLPLVGVMVFLMALASQAPAAPVTSVGAVDASGHRSWRCYGSVPTTSGLHPVVGACDPVPAGYRLVVEHVTVMIVMGTGSSSMWVRFGCSGTGCPTQQWVSLTWQKTAESSSEQWFVSSGPVHVYFESGESPTVNVGRIPNTVDGGGEISVQGYLIPLG